MKHVDDAHRKTCAYLWGPRQVENAMPSFKVTYSQPGNSLQSLRVQYISCCQAGCTCRWGAVAEKTMSRSFDTWLVHDHHDFNELRRLCHNLRIKLPEVAISKLDLPLHHIPEHHRIPADAATSLLDVVSCSEPSKNAAVMNQIIDVVRKPLNTVCICALQFRHNHTASLDR